MKQLCLNRHSNGSSVVQSFANAICAICAVDGIISMQLCTLLSLPDRRSSQLMAVLAAVLGIRSSGTLVPNLHHTDTDVLRTYHTSLKPLELLSANRREDVTDDFTQRSSDFNPGYTYIAYTSYCRSPVASSSPKRDTLRVISFTLLR